MKVAFLGLGGMGVGMARNLMKAGHEVAVWNRSRGPDEELEAEGASCLAAVADAAAAEVVISMLADDAATRSVVIDSGLVEAAKPGFIHLNMATISVQLATELTALHEALGQHYIAAPVMGRTNVAAAGELNVIAAGAPEPMERVRPLLEAMGRKIWPFGETPSRANAVKLAMNFSLTAAIEAMAEAMALVRGHGVEPKALFELMTETNFAAPAYKNYGAMIVEERYSPAGFKLTLGLKDIRLALAAAEGVHVPMPLASLVRDNFLDAIAAGDGDLDWAALGKVAARRAGQG